MKSAVTTWIMNNLNRNCWEKWTRSYVRFAFSHPWLILLPVFVLGIAASWFAAEQLKVVTDLGALLPEGTASVEALNESKERVGSTDFFVIAIASKSHDVHAIADVQDALKDRIERDWPDAEWVQVARDTSFFREHALYYFNEKKLTELKDIIDEEIIKISAESMPGMVSLLDDVEGKEEQELPARIEAWLDDDTTKKLGMPPQIDDLLQRLFNKDNPNEIDQASSTGAGIGDRLIGPKGDVGVVMVQLTTPSTDLEYARYALAKGEEYIREIPSLNNGGDLTAQVVGAYRNFREVDVVAADGRMATIVSVTLVLLSILLFFVSIRAVVIVLAPLWVAAALTMALTAAVYGRLTALTVFVLAMLAGMGIDYGIHLFGRVVANMNSGQSAQDATALSLRDSGRAVLAAAGTSIASLLALQTGHFQGFREFGVIAAVGLFFCAVSGITVLPPLFAAMERIRPFHPRQLFDGKTLWHRLFHQRQIDLYRLARWALVLAVVVTAGLAIFVPRVQFENDFRRLRGPKTGATIGYGRAIGKKASTTPAVILGRDRNQMYAAHAHMLSQLDSPTVLSFITINTFVPNKEEQLSRKDVIDKIFQAVNKRAMKRLKGQAREYVEELRQMSGASLFEEADLPQWARRIVSERDGTIGNIGHLYANVEDWNAISTTAFKDEWGDLMIDGHPLRIANSAFILADVVKMVKADGGSLLIAVFVVLALILAVFARSLRGALVLIAAVLVSAIWTVGLMGIWNVRIGLYNIIVIPVVLGVSIDTAIHLFHHHRLTGPKNLKQNLRTTGMMVTASSWTTICGFSGLLFVSHHGLRTIGVLACIGVGASWFATLLVLPYLLMRFVPKKRDTI
ncbi:MAG: MMPL family transporter [Proteobacteria bacterium]|nr:MMPL family transporter [Pseudomonadota bacterium]